MPLFVRFENFDHFFILNFSLKLKMHLIRAHVCHRLDKKVAVIKLTRELFLRYLERNLRVVALLVLGVK